MAVQVQKHTKSEPVVGDRGKVGSSGIATVTRKWKGMGADRHAPQTTYLDVVFDNGRHIAVPVGDFKK